MKKKVFISFWLLLTMGMAIVIFNSCSKNYDSRKEEIKPGPNNPNNQGAPNNPNNPSGSTGIGPASSTTDSGVVINGTRWATRNIDKPGTFTAKPEDPGMFYQWNTKTGWSSTDPLINPNVGTAWMSFWNGNGASSWEKSNNPCPAGWRIPTEQELRELVDAGSVWTTEGGVNGRLFGSMLGDGSNTFFLPAVGFRYNNDGTLSNAGSSGNYWSSTQLNSYGAYHLDFDSGYTYLHDNYGYVNRAYGFACRCVAEN